MSSSPSTAVKALVTAVVVLAAAGALAFKYWQYLTNPWTRNGQVQAQVIQVTPRVSGTIHEILVRDNQFVKAGDLLFRIDPRTFESSVDQLSAMLDRTKDEIEALKKQVEAKNAVTQSIRSQVEQARSQIRAYEATVQDTSATFRRMQVAVQSGAVSEDALGNARAEFEFAEARLQHARDTLLETQANLLEAEAEYARAKADLGAEGKANARLRTAKAALHHAQLDLEFTEVRALVDGYITNLNIRLGDHATANKPVMALVDVNSFWVWGFFKESALEKVKPGNHAVVTLMGQPGTPIQGVVESIGWGVFQKDGSTAQELLPQISATFEWIRLAQRLPVRIELTDVPPEIQLRVGTTASVLVMTGTQTDIPPQAVPPVPKPLH